MDAILAKFEDTIQSIVNLAESITHPKKKSTDAWTALTTLELMLMADVALWLYYESAMFAARNATKN